MKKSRIFFWIINFIFISQLLLVGQSGHGHESEKRINSFSTGLGQKTFDPDSLSGFDENEARQHANIGNILGLDLESFLSYTKRNFINKKYKLGNYSAKLPGTNPVPQAACTNIDFETGTTAGWTVSGDVTITSGAAMDPYGNFPEVCPGGSFSLKLGNDVNPNSSIAKQTFAVTPTNSYYLLKMAMVILNYPHAASDAAKVYIRFRDASNNIIACPYFECYYANNSAGAGSSYGLSGFQTGANGVNIGAQSYPTTYIPWTNVGFDLTPYIGTNVTIEIENDWCVFDYDWAYTYIDGECSQLVTNVAGGCSSPTGTLTAPSGMTSYSWTGPPTSTVSASNTQVVNSTVGGTYTVQCTPYSSCGTAIYTFTANLPIGISPQADFTFTTASCQSTFTVPFSDNSSLNGGPAITNYYWDFDNDGVVDNSTQNPVNTFSAIGSYTTELKVNNGSCMDSITKVITISPGPIADFIASSGCLNTITSFTSTSTPSINIASHQWDFGDFTPNGNGPNPTHTYSSPGIKSITYTVTNTDGCSSVITKTLAISPNPTAALSANTVCLGLPTTFGNTSSVAAPDAITAYAWDFDNNGTVDNGTQTPTNTYTAAGLYTTELKVTTNNGCRDSLTIQVKVNGAPTASFTPVNACINANVILNNSSSIAAPDNIASYSWNFGAGANPATGNTPNPTPLVYTSGGIKNITLNLIANTSCTASITQTVEIYAQPVANFSTTSVCQSTATAFTDLSTPTGSIVAWSWDFTNNGSVDNTTNAPTNVYPSSGTYSASLIVMDNHTCKDTVVLPLDVWGHSIPNFIPTTVCVGSVSNFSNTTNFTSNVNVGGTPTWSWDFGDLTPVSNVQDPTHTYTATSGAVYNVSLTATTSNGCVDGIVKTVTVNVLPTATFTPVNACMNSNVLLNNTSNIPLPDNITTYSWIFGPGSAPTSTSNIQNPPVLTYNSSGVKSITLIVTANTTCSASITQTVDIYPQPVANFSTTSVCQSTATAYTDLSTTSVGTITGWQWDFTSNSSVDNTTSAPNNVFIASGTFTTTLIATTSNGCKDTVAMPVNVWGHTIPDFTPDKVCFGAANTFSNLTNETTNANVGTGTTYLWNFADGTTSGLTNPNHTYTLGGNANATYSVLLVATSQHNCIDSIRKVVNVYAVPTASFTSDSVCLGTPSHMTDASNGHGNMVNTYAWDFLSDGSVDVSGVANPNFTFPAFGNNLVTYTVSTSPVVGLVCANITNTIGVWVNPNPVPDFTFVNKCINAQPNTFNGSPSVIAIGTNSSYLWTYGDGNVSAPLAASASSHTYLAAGVYNVTLTITSNKGCQAAVTKQVEVYEKPYVKIANSPACDQAAMTFTAITLPNSGSIVNWFWDFNNSISTFEGAGQNTGFTFSGPGSHTAAVIAETNHGCKDTVIKAIYVNYNPVAVFSGDKLSGCPIPDHCVNFTDASPAIPGPGQISQWQWTLGDGTTVTNPTNAPINHCYDNTSSSQLAFFSISLVVTTDSGCVSPINNKPNYITVFPTPIAVYTVNPAPGNILTPLEYFTNQSIDYTKWWWSFGDGPFKTDSVNVDPTHFYSDASAGTYYSNLIVMNQYGCSDTAYVPVEIQPEFTFYIPNAFTPANNDNINDYFTGKGIGIAHFEMWIFDRWGEKIFYTDDIEKGWNGKVQGKSADCQQDVYIWKVKLKDVLDKKHEYIGHVTLLK